MNVRELNDIGNRKERRLENFEDDRSDIVVKRSDGRYPDLGIVSRAYIDGGHKWLKSFSKVETIAPATLSKCGQLTTRSRGSIDVVRPDLGIESPSRMKQSSVCFFPNGHERIEMLRDGF